MRVADLLPILERSSVHLRKLDAVLQAHLIDDPEGLDALLTAVDLADLRACAVELETVIQRHSLVLASPPSSPPLRGGARVTPRRLAPVPDPDSFNRKVW